MMHSQHDPNAEDGHSAQPEPAPQPPRDPQAQIEALQAEIAQLRDQSLRDRADLDNQRKRLERDVRNACRFANKQLLNDLLPVFDSIEASLDNAAVEDPLRDGVVLTLRELNRVAEANGLVEVAPKPGEPFNPEHHQAMSMVDAPDIAPGSVANVLQKGYLLNDQLLRPALVQVARTD